MVPAGTVLYTSRAPIGYTAIAAQSVCTNQGFKSLVPPDGVTSDYLYWYMRHATETVRSMASGTTFPEVSGRAMAEVPIVIAPTAEQVRIVAAIEEEFSRLDAGVAALDRVRHNLKRMRATAYNAAVAGLMGSHTDDDSGGTPEGWETTTIGDLTTLITSGSRGWAQFYAESGPFFLRAQNIRFGRLRLEDKAYVQLPPGSEGTRTRVSIHDLVIVITGAGVTNPALVDHDLGETYVSQHVGLIRLKDPTLATWLLVWLMASDGGRSELTRRAYGAGKPGLNLDNLRTLPIAIPPDAKREAVLARLQTTIDGCTCAEMELNGSYRQTNRLRASILAAAFSGTLVPQDPSDEPATVLLERVAAERASSNGHKPARTRKTRAKVPA